ncbi:MAG: 3-hydroxybutyryl-CoA dehydrogenase [Anaerolineales bacterium]|nr:3-hydroxybutyryl-CoA dehydrogenase [Anaerolineales bacterium]
MVKIVGVLGAGQMGNGIAHVFAQYGYQVLLYDISAVQLEKALKTIQQNLERQAKKGVIDPGSIQPIMDRIALAKAIGDFSACDLVIEAVNENETLKFDLFRQLDETVNKDAILASNTSSISITKIGAATKRPDKVIGMHFMNPVPIMQLVEVIRGLATSDETFQAIASLVEKLGKVMAVSQDYPGFIVNRILMPMINEAIFALYEGIATAEDIDKGMKLGTNHPMGPLALADLIGLDTVLAIITVLYEGFKDPKFRPCPLLVKMVNAGYLGKKSGRGFYTY